MPIDDKNKVIFIHIPKNGGTSIEKNLKMWDSGHRTSESYMKKFPSRWKNYKKVCFFRDPVERIVSCYNYAKMDNSYWHSKDGKAIYGKHPDYDICNKLHLDEIIEGIYYSKISLVHPGWKPQHHWIAKGSDLLVHDIKRICQINEWLNEMGVENPTLLNASGKKSSTSMIGESKRMVEKIYSLDYKIFKDLK
jgi:hypothetical protein